MPDAVADDARKGYASGIADDMLDQLVAQLQREYEVRVDQSAIDQRAGLLTNEQSEDPLSPKSRPGPSSPSKRRRTPSASSCPAKQRQARSAPFSWRCRVRGETVAEISGAVATMRDKMLRVEAPDGAIDIVGTGGDNSHSVNISTASAFVIAGSGVPVAKHGNRGLSSQTGAADVLTALGIKIDLPPEAIGRCIREAGVGFMFAPAHHPAMRHVGPMRAELGTRTIFNLLGPLSNPAGVAGRWSACSRRNGSSRWPRRLKTLGADHAWVAHGDGLDEITTTGETQVAELVDGEVRSFTLTPEAFGLPRHTQEELRGGDAAFNAAALRAMLEGKPAPIATRC